MKKISWWSGFWTGQPEMMLSCWESPPWRRLVGGVVFELANQALPVAGRLVLLPASNSPRAPPAQVDVDLTPSLLGAGMSLSYREIIECRIYRTFQHIEKNIVSNLQYRVSRYWFILCFSAENSPKIPKFLLKSENSPEIPKILRKFRKFSENSLNYVQCCSTFI